MGVCNCTLFCCTLLYVHSFIAVILMGKRKLVPLLNLSSWCLVMVEWLFLEVPWGCLRFVIEVFPDHTHLLFLAVSKCHFTISETLHRCHMPATFGVFVKEDRDEVSYYTDFLNFIKYRKIKYHY